MFDLNKIKDNFDKVYSDKDFEITKKLYEFTKDVKHVPQYELVNENIQK